jgi:predicted MPP superfamily phosphohydrolase
MKILQFIVFISIVLSIYFSVNYYIYIRGLQAFSVTPEWKSVYKIVFWTVVSSFIVGEILEHTSSSAFGEWVYRVGAFWTAFMLYLFIAVVLIDMIRIIDKLVPIIPLIIKQDPAKYRFIAGITVFSIVSVIVIIGHLNTLRTKIHEISLHIPKTAHSNPGMKILMASDIHFGALIGDRREHKLVEIIKSQKPDLVLLCGDIIDGDIAPALRKNLGRHLQDINPPMGMYAIPGNHEYIGGIHKTIPYLESINIKILRDEIISLPNGVQIVGRDDKDANRIGVSRRKTLSELTSQLDKSKPVIVMNHQPYNLDEAVENGVDLHLSGHTHHGQMWPLNYITSAIFEKSRGYLKKGETHCYISSGFGTWGPSVRIGNTPEVVVFNITFK